MSKKQDNNQQKIVHTNRLRPNTDCHDNKLVDIKTPLKKKQQIKNDQVFWSLSPFPLPPKFNNQHTAISQSYNAFNDGLKIIQTPYHCSYPIYRRSDMEDINDELRLITNKIEWDKTPAKSQNSSSQYDQQSSSQQNSSIIQQQYEGKQPYQESQLSQKNTQNKNQAEKNSKILYSKSKNLQKRGSGSKKVTHLISIPQPNNLNKKVVCNCKKTKCLKLYCDCFRINQTCEGCNCVGCHNLQEYADQRNSAILALMDRNPDPFSQKIQDDKHLKGCNCKKSFCLKKYCQCYQAGLQCRQNCKCDECKNGGGSQKRQRDRIERQQNLLNIKIDAE